MKRADITRRGVLVKKHFMCQKHCVPIDLRMRATQDIDTCGSRPKIPEFLDTVLSRLHYTGAVKDAVEDAADKERRCSCGRCC